MTIELTDEMRQRLATALADGCPVIAASVHPDGRPKLSFYGSTQAHDDQTLAVWARDPEAGLLARIATNPHLALVSRNGAERIFWQFEGRASVTDEPAVRAAVYDASPAPERDRDPDRRGAAVLVALDRVTGRGFVMER